MLFTDALARQHPGLRPVRPRWMLLDLAERVLPGLDPRMSAGAARVLAGRGVDVRTGISVAEACADGVRLTDGSFVPTRTLIWCVGVRPDPLVAALGLETEHGRLVVDEYLTVPGHPEIVACGDAAAVPDLTRPGEITAMTAQHATRQGHAAAHAVAASYGDGEPKPYKHHDLGFVVDLAGRDAVANPLGAAAVRAAREGRDPRLPPAVDPREPDPGRQRLAARCRAPAAGRPARARDGCVRTARQRAGGAAQHRGSLRPLGRSPGRRWPSYTCSMRPGVDWQPSLLDGGPPAPDASFGRLTRLQLDEHSVGRPLPRLAQRIRRGLRVPLRRGTLAAAHGAHV